MTHLISGLMSWVKSESTSNKSYRGELLTWAKTEYGNDWQYAYDHMLNNHGKAPTSQQIHGPRIVLKNSSVKEVA